MYYDTFEKLCALHGTKPAHVASATGVKTATLSSWKNGTYTPKVDKLMAIADYFGVTIDYLVRGEEANAIADTANKDYALSRMPDKIKEYALKLSKLDQEKQNQIMSLIDMLDNKN